MVVKSSTKKRLVDLGVGEGWAHQLADDRKWADVVKLSIKDWCSILGYPTGIGRPSARMVREYNFVRKGAGLPNYVFEGPELLRTNPPNCVNWRKILNLWQCKGCQRWVPEKGIDEYKETCDICAKAYSDYDGPTSYVKEVSK